jgi:secreted trypsin-like serine protease
MRRARAGRRACVITVVALVAAISVVLVPGAGADAQIAPTSSRDPDYSASIVNGSEASLDQWPFIVAILARSEPLTYYAQFCDGSLVTPTIVLTAQHCTYDGNGDPLQPNQVDVLVNADDLSRRTSHEGDRIHVTQIIRYPGYSPATIRHDIALFVLDTPATATPVALVPSSSDYRWAGGRDARVAGFGCAQYDADPSPGACTTNGYPIHLRETPIPMMSDSDCANLGGVYTANFDPATMVCAGTLGSVRTTSPGIEEGDAKSPCFGDSGGPLVIEGPGGTDYQVGVVSWGPSACGIGPGVFSRLGDDDVRVWMRANGVPVARSPFAAGPAVKFGGDFTPIAGDFDGDGKSDIFWYQPGSDRDFLYRGTADGFDDVPGYSMGRDYRPFAGDFDGDGFDDIFWYGAGDALDVLWRGTPTGFTMGPSVTTDRVAVPVVGDFDGDGFDDIFWYGPGTRGDALWRGSAGGFIAGPPVRQDDVRTPVVGDFDGDGKDDILWYGAGDLSDTVWRGDAAGFGAHLALNVTADVQPVAGDFDGDGKADVLYFSATGPDLVRRGTATGFQNAPEVRLDGDYLGVPGDFNGDGRDDVVWYGAGSNPDKYWRGARR